MRYSPSYEANERTSLARHEASRNPKVHYLAICPDHK